MRPPRGPKELSETPKTLQEASTGGPSLCVLPTFLIEAIPLGIVSGWAGGVTFLVATALQRAGGERGSGARAGLISY
eukprot:2036959-Pyramimonas_sp.AAC.1